jgi:hypothetical protein
VLVPPIAARLTPIVAAPLDRGGQALIALEVLPEHVPLLGGGPPFKGRFVGSGQRATRQADLVASGNNDDPDGNRR